MNWITYIFFIIIFNAEYFFDKIGLKFKLLVVLPELFSIVAGIYLLLIFAFTGKARIQGRYLCLYIFIAVHIAIGLVGNQVQPLAIFSGLRIYFRYLPFYFLPMVYVQSNDQIKRIVLLLLATSILQFPLAFYQRFVEIKMVSGDFIAGTLGRAPALSIYLLCSISILMGFYLKKKISTRSFIALIIVFFLPTTINETKATVILLPMAILIPSLFEVGKETRLKIIFGVIPIFAFLLFGFNYAYHKIYGRGSGVVSFYSTDEVGSYLYKGSDSDRVSGREGEVGRLDSIVLAYKEGSDNLFRLIWGGGIGNSALPFSSAFGGEYNREYMRLGGKMTGVSHLIWEIGLLGLFYVIWFIVLTFHDALALRKRNDINGPLSLGWLGVVVIFVAVLPYQNIIQKDALMYAFLYFSGHLAAVHYMAKNNSLPSDEESATSN